MMKLGVPLGGIFTGAAIPIPCFMRAAPEAWP